MFNFARSDAQRIAVSAAGALLFSGLCISGAVAPAQASAAPATVSAWQTDADNRLDAAMLTMPDNARRFARTDAAIAATIAADGTLSDAQIVESSGSRTADAAMLFRTVRLRLAPLPADIDSRNIVLKIALIDSSPLRSTRQPRVTVRYAAR